MVMASHNHATPKIAPLASSQHTNSTEDFAEKHPDMDAEKAAAQPHDELAADELDRDLQLEGGIEGREDLKAPSEHGNKDLTRINSVTNVNSIPNGGLRAWLQVAGAFVLFFNTWGILNTFGVYQVRTICIIS